MRIRRTAGLVAAAGLAVGLVGATVAPANAGPRHDNNGYSQSVRGYTTITANDGVTGALLDAGLAVFAVDPATASLTDDGTRLALRLPVTRVGTKIKHAGGFAVVNLRDGGQVTCLRPSIRLEDSTVTCFVPELDQRIAVFTVTSVGSVDTQGRWVRVEGAQLAIVDQATADTLNSALNTTVFTTGVDLFTADVIARKQWRGHHWNHWDHWNDWGSNS